MKQDEADKSRASFPVLIAEDDPVSRKLLEKVLVRAGYEVVSVENGRKALERFDEKFFPILLTDWVMPEMDGLQLCRAIRERDSDGYVFIILLTAHDSKDAIVTALEAGADEYLTKPFNHAELIARLNTARRILELEKSLKKANEEIRILSITDPLTGCYNRCYLSEHLPMEIKRARRYGHPLSLAMCDIDHFKQVNDRYGHRAGDCVLKAFVQRIQKSIRENVDWLARYGGEEFLIVFPETGTKNAYCVAERLRRTIARNPIRIQETEIRITASFGVAGFDSAAADEKTSAETLIAKADSCLYQAKRKGRNMVISSPPAKT